jgi:hypothetical protein
MVGVGNIISAANTGRSAPYIYIYIYIYMLFSQATYYIHTYIETAGSYRCTRQSPINFMFLRQDKTKAPVHADQGWPAKQTISRMIETETKNLVKGL